MQAAQHGGGFCHHALKARQKQELQREIAVYGQQRAAAVAATPCWKQATRKA